MKRSILNLVNQAWLMAWLVAFPLVHVHPEADHAHGATSHIHGGLYHSVLSNDLSCEFHETVHHSHAPRQTNHVGLMKSVHTSSHVLGHTEISFSLLNRTLPDQCVSPPHADYLIVDWAQERSVRVSSLEVPYSGNSLPFWRLASSHRSRPPPFFLLVNIKRHHDHINHLQ